MQISTDYVFGAVPSPPRPWREDDPCQPQGVYARTKLEGEQAAAKHEKHLIVRTCGLYARPSDPRAANFVKTMLRLGAARPELRIVDDQHCTPTFVPHLARAILFLLGVGGSLVVQRSRLPEQAGRLPQQPPWGTYHVTNTGEATWREFAAEIFRQAGMQVAVRADHHGRIRSAGGPAVVQRARHVGVPSARRPGDAAIGKRRWGSILRSGGN